MYVPTINTRLALIFVSSDRLISFFLYLFSFFVRHGFPLLFFGYYMFHSVFLPNTRPFSVNTKTFSTIVKWFYYFFSFFISSSFFRLCFHLLFVTYFRLFILPFFITLTFFSLHSHVFFYRYMFSSINNLVSLLFSTSMHTSLLLDLFLFCPALSISSFLLLFPS